MESNDYDKTLTESDLRDTHDISHELRTIQLGY